MFQTIAEAEACVWDPETSLNPPSTFTDRVCVCVYVYVEGEA